MNTDKQTSVSQREIFIRLVQVDEQTLREAAKISGINENTARSIMCRYRRDGSLMNKVIIN